MFDSLIKEKLNKMTLLIIKEIPFYEFNEFELAMEKSKENENLELLLLAEKVQTFCIRSLVIYDQLVMTSAFFHDQWDFVPRG